MNNQINLFLNIDENPKGTAQMKGEMVRGGRIHHYEKANVARQRAIYRREILAELEAKDIEIPCYEGPVVLKVIFNYAIKDAKRWGQWKTSRPDLDNSVKLLQDVLTELGFFKDDSQIAKLVLEKRFSAHPLIEIEMGRLMDP